MNKSLQILLGLLLILVLAYVAFLDVSTKIKDDLLTKTKVMFSENNVRGVTANMQGEGSNMSRSLLLTGTAISEVERVRIVTLARNIEGVCSVENEIILHPAVPKVPLVPKVPSAMKVPVSSPSAKAVVPKETPKELKPMSKAVENKVEISSVPAKEITTNIPSVPRVMSKSIVVPTPVEAVSAPKVIKIEKIKLEGVK